MKDPDLIPVDEDGLVILTEEEKKAIRSLKRVAKKWPSSLWLFSASGHLCVMKKTPDGERLVTDGGGVNPSVVADTIHGIENDGGDW